jgi:polyisoprenoid-binding protein YceI
MKRYLPDVKEDLGSLGRGEFESGLLLSFLTLIALAGATAVRADSYKIDPVHSRILFKIGHFGVGNIYGRFDSFSGDITFDQNAPSKDAVNVKIKNR